MARLKHRESGVVVEVSDGQVEALAGQFEPVEQPKRSRSARKSSDEK